MSKKRAWTFRKPNSFESSVRLLWGFAGAAAVAATGKVFDGSRDSDVWTYALLVILIATSYGQGTLAAAYNGFMFGLFLNFFFLSQDQILSFDSVGDWWLELTFVAVGIVASLVGRWMPQGPDRPAGESAPFPEDQGQPFVWPSHSSNGHSSSSKEKSWTS